MVEMPMWQFLLTLVLLTILSVILGYIVRVIQYEHGLKKTNNMLKQIISDGEKEAEKLKKDYLAEGKQEIANLKNEAEKEIKDRKQVVVDLEHK